MVAEIMSTEGTSEQNALSLEVALRRRGEPKSAPAHLLREQSASHTAGRGAGVGYPSTVQHLADKNQSFTCE